jgi:hypothetical protein
MRLSRFVWIALVPALAFGAPKGKPAPKKKKAPTSEPAPPSEPATPPAEPGTGSGENKPAPATPAGAPATPAPGAGSGSAAPTPEKRDEKTEKKDEKAEKAEKPEKSEGPDVDSLRQEYLALRDELFKSRARANAVSSQLYSTRVQIKLTYTTGRYYNPQKTAIRLDGATVYEDAGGAIANDDGVRFDGYVAPGRHLVSFRIEATGKDDDTFTSVTETQIVVKAVSGKDLLVAAKARDSGDIAYQWKKSEKGTYGLAVDVAVKTGAHEEKK